MKTLAQRNNGWKNIPLGTSKNTTIGSHGCTITCVAMLAGLTPDEVNRRLLKVGGYAYTNLIIWTKIKEAIPWLEFEWRGYGYNNDRVKAAAAKNGGCLVECDFDNNAATTRDKHWILFTGKGKMNDPWSGRTESTSKYNDYTGYAVINKIGEKPKGEDMSGTYVDKETFGNLVSKSGKYDAFVTAGYSDPKKLGEAIDEQNRTIAGLRTTNAALVETNKQLKDSETDAVELQKIVTEYDMVKSVLKNGFAFTDKSFKDEKTVFAALESLTRGGNAQNLSTAELLATIWGRFMRSLDKSKE